MATADTICFLDCETTGLDPERHQAWEVAAIVRMPGERDVELETQLPVWLGDADARALTVGDFYGRYRESDAQATSAFCAQFARLTHGARIVGANPTFDVTFLSRLLRQNGACPGWHHRLICVETLVAGKTGVFPDGLRGAAEMVGIDTDFYALHTALGDAQLARDVFDAIGVKV